jgi:2-polyprenyl-3-methyl-5-hydroxy-6-metoxy-1,4-benzoquinol methylase
MKKKNFKFLNIRALKEHYEIQGKESNFDVYTGSWNIRNALFKRRREVIRSILPHDHGIALDLGCGVGIYSLDLCRIGYEVISVDISKSYLEKVKILRSKVNKEWHLILADASNLPFRKDSFDFILCTEVLEHLQNMLKALIEIIRCIKLKGILVLSVPSRFSFTEMFLYGGEHLHKINPIWLREFLRINGFLLLKERYCNFGIFPIRRALFKYEISNLEHLVIIFWLGLDKLVGRIPLVKLISWCYTAKFVKAKNKVRGKDK